jgi:hypothetical protein
MPSLVAGLTRHPTDILAVAVDHIRDFLGVVARVRPRIDNGAPQAHIVSKNVRALRILEDVVDIRLPNAKLAVEVASVVRLVPFGHLVPPF